MKNRKRLIAPPTKGKKAMPLPSSGMKASRTVAFTGMPIYSGTGRLSHAKELIQTNATHTLPNPVAGFKPSQLTDVEGMLADHELVFAVYEAPWDAVTCLDQAEAPDFLADWCSYHAGLLRLRQTYLDKLVLINVQRFKDSMPSLIEKINAACSVTLVALTGNNDPAAQEVTDSLSSLHAKSIDWLAPEIWDMYEALESCAWLGNGQPEYRDDLTLPGSLDLSAVTAEWWRAHQLPRVIEQKNAELTEMHAQTNILEADLKSALAHGHGLEEQVAGLNAHVAEQEARFAQLATQAQVRIDEKEAQTSAIESRLATTEAALEAERSALQAMADRAAESEATVLELRASLLAQAARAEQVEAELRSAMLRQSEEARIQQQSLADALRQETEKGRLLQVALDNQIEESTRTERELQASLERLANDADTREGTLKASLAREAEVAKKRELELQAALEQQSRESQERMLALQASLDTEKKDAQKLKQEMEASLQSSIEEAKQRDQALQAKLLLAQQEKGASAAEASTLLEQLHQVQEALESALLEGLEAVKAKDRVNAALAAEVEKLRTEVRTALDNAKTIESTVKAKSEAALVQERALKLQIAELEKGAKMAREEADNSRKLAQDYRDKLDAELQRHAMTTAREAKLNEKLVQASRRLEEVESQAAQSSEKLRTVVADADKRYQTLLAEKAKVTAEASRLSDELLKTTTKSNSLETELEHRTKTEAEQEQKLRHSVTSLEKRAKDAEAESALLLLQLHQVQEELERYFAKSRDVTIALEKSTQSFNRARRIVTQLVTSRAA